MSVHADDGSELCLGAAGQRSRGGDAAANAGVQVQQCPDRFEHTFKVTVTRVATELQLTVNRYVVTTGQSIRFNAAANPSRSATGSTLGLSGTVWTFTPDSGVAQTVTGCSGLVTCPYAPPGSGTMSVTAITNGVSKTATVRVRVLCASTGDPLLDSLPILDMLKTAWDSSNWTAPAAQRRERSVSTVCDTLTGACRVFIHVRGPDDPIPDTPCNHVLSLPTLGQHEIVVVNGHDHPFRYHDGLPVHECQLPMSMFSPWYDNDRLGGPSQIDYQSLASETIPHYIIDRDFIIRIMPGTTEFNWNSNYPGGGKRVTKIKRKSGGCTIL